MQIKQSFGIVVIDSRSLLHAVRIYSKKKFSLVEFMIIHIQYKKVLHGGLMKKKKRNKKGRRDKRRQREREISSSIYPLQSAVETQRKRIRRGGRGRKE